MKRISLKKIIIMIIIILSVMGYNYYVVNKYVNAINVMHQKLLSMASSYYTVKQNLIKIAANTKVNLSSKENEKLKKLLMSLGNLNKSLIIFRFYDSSCNPCIERELLNLVNFKVSHPKTDIIIGANLDEKKIRSKILSIGLEAKIVVLCEDDKLLPFEKDEEFYICLIDENFNVSNLFFPMQNDNNFSISYLGAGVGYVQEMIYTMSTMVLNNHSIGLHNEYMRLFIELGFIPYITYFVLIWPVSIKILYNKVGYRVALMYFVLWIVNGICIATDNLLTYPNFMLAFWLILITIINETPDRSGELAIK